MTELKPDMSKVVPWSVYLGAANDERVQAERYYSEAREFLEFYDWCLEIRETFVGIMRPGIIAVLLFRIKPGEAADEWIWVVVGDLPPAYLTVDDCPNPATALDGYIGAMQEWIDAAMADESVADLIPVNVPATTENATSLQGRLEFLDERILSDFKQDLKF